MAQGSTLFNQSQSRWDNLGSIAPGEMSVSGTNDPDGLLSALVTDGTATAGVWLTAMSGTAVSQMFFSLELPHRYIAGTDVNVYVNWAPTTGSAAGVSWALEYSTANKDGVFGNTTTIEATDATAEVANTRQCGVVGTITGTTFQEDTMIIGRVYRNTGATGDTYTDYVDFLGLSFHGKTLESGSVAEYGDG